MCLGSESMRIGLISLGCSKNLVDSEMMLGLFKNNNFEIVNDVKVADLLVINTCGFIQSAKQEAITTIFDVIKNKKEEADVFVVGCLAQRYFDTLVEEMPEVSKFIKIDDYARFGEIINEYYQASLIKERGLSPLKRVFATPHHVSYIRIADGCNNRCTYCAIPLIRGNYKSRLIVDIVHEVKLHVAKGRSEINLISQDTTNFGKDNHETLEQLLLKLVPIEGIKMIRLLYLYPEEVSDELIRIIRDNPIIAPYFDIPIQHGSTRILRLMNRRDTYDSIVALTDKIRQQIPHSILRTSLIVGFPDEQEEDFSMLKSIVQRVQFDRLGVFKYSAEDDTIAATMPHQIEEEIKENRYKDIMKTQQKIAYQLSKKRIGEQQVVFVEGYDHNLKKYKSRDYSFAPDNIDGFIYFESKEQYHVGDLVKVKITGAYIYDLIAVALDD